MGANLIMKKKYYIIPLVVSIIALITGASFHGMRMHPENVGRYNLGVTMGVTMASVAALSFIVFVIMLILYWRNSK